VGGTRVDAIGTEGAIGDRSGAGVMGGAADELCCIENLVGVGGTLPVILLALSPPPITVGGKRGRAIVKRVG
jgi:hypothetical protein